MSGAMSNKKLLEQIRYFIRARNLSLRTEQVYLQWKKRFILFHNKCHPAQMGAAEVNQFLTHLAVKAKVAASTRNQALNAIIFMYKQFMQKNIGDLGSYIRAKRTQKVPSVLSQDEVRLVLNQMHGAYKRLSFAIGIKVCHLGLIVSLILNLIINPLLIFDIFMTTLLIPGCIIK